MNRILATTQIPHHPSPVAMPTIIEHTEEGFTARQLMPSRSPYQDGHYPDLPIYPGVFFIESVVNASRAYAQLGGIDPAIVSLSNVESVRFISPGTPGESFTITVRQKGSGEGAGTEGVSALCSDECGRVLAEMLLCFDSDTLLTRRR